MVKQRVSRAFALDSSALLALLRREAGAERVLAVIEHGVISAVNLCEVLGKLHDLARPRGEIEAVMQTLEMEIVPFDDAQAERAAALRPLTRAKGLSLGDRACLALAATRGIPALTGDRAWTEVDTGVTIELFR